MGGILTKMPPMGLTDSTAYFPSCLWTPAPPVLSLRLQGMLEKQVSGETVEEPEEEAAERVRFDDKVSFIEAPLASCPPALELELREETAEELALVKQSQ